MYFFYPETQGRTLEELAFCKLILFFSGVLMCLSGGRLMCVIKQCSKIKN